MKYYQPYGVQDVNASYVNGDPSIGRQGSIIPAGAVEMDQREIVAAIQAAALIPADNDNQQLLKAIRSQRMNYASATNAAGSENAVSVTFDPQIGNALTPGLPLRIKGHVNNLGPCTLSVDGISNPLKHADATALVADEIKAGQIFEAIWNDGGYWEFNSFMGGTGGGDITNTNTYINIPYTTDVGTVNAMIANFVPAIPTLVAGLTIEVKLANTITGATTIKVNTLAPVPVVRGDGTALQANDAVAGQIMLLIYSTATGQFQFTGVLPKTYSGLGPVGSIILCPNGTPFPGTLKLNGAMLNRVDHPLLWAYANGGTRLVNEIDWQTAASRYWTAFSRGDGTTTFRLPDFRGEFMRFFDDARGVDPGRVLGQQQKDQVGAFSGSGNISISSVVGEGSGATYGGYYANILPLVTGNSAAPGAGNQLMTSAAGGGTGMPWEPCQKLNGVMTATFNPGLETRVRNTAVVACIVDG